MFIHNLKQPLSDGHCTVYTVRLINVLVYIIGAGIWLQNQTPPTGFLQLKISN